MKKIDNYTITCSSSIVILCERVNKLLSEDWELSGSTFVDKNGILYQTLIKYNE